MCMQKLYYSLLSLAIITAVSSAHAAAQHEDTLVVTASGFTQVAGASISATKTDTPLTGIPQSVSVITSEQISEQGAHTLNQVLRYTPGVAPEMRGATGTRSDSFHLRSFSSSIYLDGLRVYGGPQADAWRLERVDVLKGPASVMYGRGDPGGLVNMISKRPLTEVRREIELQGGNYDYGRASFDFGGPLDPEGRYLYRLVGSGYLSDGQIKDTRERRYYVSPAFTWNPGVDTSFTVLTHFQRDPAMGSNGSVSPMRTLLLAPDGIRLPANFYDGDANFEKSDRKSYSLGYVLDHRFNDTFKAVQSLRWTHSDNKTRSVTSAFRPDWGYTDSSYLYRRRSASVSDESVGALTLDTNLQAGFNTGVLGHTVLVGLDYQHIKTHTVSGSGSAPMLNVLNPDNHLDIPVPAFSKNASQARYQTGLYFQDQMKIGRLSVLLNGRYDWSRELNGSTAIATGRRISASAVRAQAFSGRIGAIYQLDNGVAPYLNYSESFEPLGMTGWNDVPFKPVRGSQYEAGVKYQPPGGNTLLSVAAFDIRLANMPTTDLDPTHLCGRGWPCSIQSSEIRTQGFEFEARTEPLRGLSLLAGYSLQDSFYSRANPDSSGFNQKGKSSTVTPTHQASAWMRYQLQEGVLAGLGVGGGVRYLGTSYADEANTLKVPAATLFDLRLDYDLGRATPLLKGMQVALNVQNLFDKEYIASCLSGISWCWYGYQRSITASLRYRW